MTGLISGGSIDGSEKTMATIRLVVVDRYHNRQRSRPVTADTLDQEARKVEHVAFVLSCRDFQLDPPGLAPRWLLLAPPEEASR